MAALLAERRATHAYVDVVHSLRSQRRYVERDALLVGLLDLAEAEARETGAAVAAWPYLDLAAVYNMTRNPDAELAVLERLESQDHGPEGTPAALVTRLARLRREPLPSGMPRHYSRDPRLEPWAPMFGKPTRPQVVSEHISSWWAPQHDQMIVDEIKLRRWYWDVSQAVLESIPPDDLQIWKAVDPAIGKLSETALIRDYADHRVAAQKIAVPSPAPLPKLCACCAQPFIESSVPPRRLSGPGFESIPYCRVCIDQVDEGSWHSSPAEIVGYIRDVFAEFCCVPTSGWPLSLHASAAPENRVRAFQILARRPTRDAVKAAFGGWFQAMAAAGIVDAAGERGYFGTRSVATDGHVCLSMGERTICELLTSAGVEHAHEPRYPDSKMRADFRIGHAYVEYLGLAGRQDYDEKTERKKAHAQRHGLQLELVYPRELGEQDRLLKRLAKLAVPQK